MNINDAFPSKYIKANDLKGHDVLVTVARVTREDVGGNGEEGDIKPIVYFQGTKKGLVLNKTNCNRIASMYGPETDAWVGKQVTLFPTETEFGGNMVDCIRIRKGNPSLQDVVNSGEPVPAGADNDGEPPF